MRRVGLIACLWGGQFCSAATAIEAARRRPADLFGAIAAIIHGKDMDVMGKPVEQRADEPLGTDYVIMPFSSIVCCAVFGRGDSRSDRWAAQFTKVDLSSVAFL